MKKLTDKQFNALSNLQDNAENIINFLDNDIDPIIDKMEKDIEGIRKYYGPHSKRYKQVKKAFAAFTAAVTSLGVVADDINGEAENRFEQDRTNPLSKG